MKLKLMGIIVCIMLVTTLFAVAQPSQLRQKQTKEPVPVPTTSAAEVPVWEVGNQWTYKVDNLTINYNEPERVVNLYLSMAELPLTVAAVDDTTYTVDFGTSMTGQSSVDVNLGDGPINGTITLPNMKIEGSIIFEKSTLGIKALSATLNGRFWVDIKQQPYLPFSVPVLPVKMKVDLLTDFSNNVTLVSFPLNTSMMWNSTATNLTLNGEIRSPWLYVMLLINQIAALAQYELLPPEIVALLPVVNIKDAFDTLGTGNTFAIPSIPAAFMSMNNTESVTVPSGTYNAYNITIITGMARCYYAPAAKNIIKIAGNIQDIIPFVTNIKMELKSTNVS